MIAERIRIAGASVIGRDHMKKNGVCQDRVFHLVNNGTYVASLCDGAGSKSNSHFGAEIISKAIANYVSESFIDIEMSLESRGLDSSVAANNLEELKKRIIDYLVSKLADYASSQNGIEIDDLSCTMMFVAVHENRFIAGHIGDGVIGVLKTDYGSQKLRVLSNPENGNSPNVTFFVNDKNSFGHLRLYFGDMSGITGFILMSDGPEEALYNKRDGLSDNCSILFQALEGTSDSEYIEFLTNILQKKISDVSHDDLSINILFRESIDTNEVTNEDILKEYFDELYDNQIVKMSKYAVFIDKSICGIGNKIKWQDRLTELKRRFDS